MTAPKRRISDRLAVWQKIVGISLGAAAILGLAVAAPDQVYKVWPNRQVERHISAKQQDVRDALEFQNALLMSQMTVEDIDKASKLYKASKMGRGTK